MSYPIIMQDFSIAGIKKQWEWQQKCERIGKFRKPIADNMTQALSESLGINIEPSSDVELAAAFNEMAQLKNQNIGCKTETRRLTGLKEINKNPDEWVFSEIDISQGETNAIFLGGSNRGYKWIKSPYGVAGDELWVREKFFAGYQLDENDAIPEDAKLQYWYGADQPYSRPFDMSDFKCAFLFGNDKIDWPRWKSPLFMPREASRITLINEGVSIERLQSITEEGALREGCSIGIKPSYLHGASGFETSKVLEYKLRWKDMHGEESWEKNVWCWVLKFTVKEIKS